ncbi:cell envelope rod binding protein [Leptospira ryugenii]|uniref:Cell envelope rod binding protein n=1 Tax=Leptospira ryugenii TaxID=1917863 RepID=A0A2P2DXD5_9LEPT|nr:rod-binding protein [Leptospira ryugenii]GBF49282.1 cell envelope rod binding protein [Leptospira ryugenii]
MDIFSINDYSSRISRSREDQILKSISKEGKFSEPTTQSNFEALIKERQDLMGKVSSSSLSVPLNIKEEISSDPYRKKLYDASVEFESVFVKMMLKEMKNSVHKEKLIDGGYAEEIFEDMLYDEYAKNISKNESLGLAEEIYKQMSVHLPKSRSNPYS